ncbi:molybdenum cofactor guanylyltransferase [Sphingomonas sp.]|uniref:molybdenum cofactor guanylyltransferase n=1 Tax=Sphingomonas sp. TaxID=28214 RepID=UPI001B2A283E|nr:molybdenum cofactor guanylyltransferase [Sphingomonas sp.]MBO9715034.1 molybdenum cofactor guanylyltransferase [Sphingomonas sp.]
MIRILGAVLAGGRATRFGSDKALALLDGASLLDHALRALAPWCEAVAICGREVPGSLSLADRPRPGMGPLGGLNAALHHAAAHGFAGVLATGCDMPRFPPEVARALIGEGPAALEGQPLAGYWPATLAPVLDAHLAASDDRSIRAFLKLVGARAAAVPAPSLPNVNAPADLVALRRGEAAGK